jgi:hypothetical protein
MPKGKNHDSDNQPGSHAAGTFLALNSERFEQRLLASSGKTIKNWPALETYAVSQERVRNSFSGTRVFWLRWRDKSSPRKIM